MLKKQVGEEPSEGSREAKEVTQVLPGSRRPRGGQGGQGSGGCASASSNRGGGQQGGSSYYGGGHGGGQNDSATGSGYPQASMCNNVGRAPAAGSGGGHPQVLAPTTAGRFSGSDVQRAHVEAMRRANLAEATAAPVDRTAELAVRSDLGLEAIRERKQKEEDERNAKREAARTKRHNKETQREVEDMQALFDCEAQAQRDAATNERVKYEAALIVRIATRFAPGVVWMRIAEARSRGADIPMDPKGIYRLAHPDKCPLPEATDATAILNAQRPPEMTEVKARLATFAVGAAGCGKERDASAAEAAAADPEAAARAARFAARREARARSGASVAATSSAAATAAQPSDGEAFAAMGVAAAAAAVSSESPRREEEEERRQDPEDNETRSWLEVLRKYSQTYAAAEIRKYWETECKPLGAEGNPEVAEAAAAPSAKATAASSPTVVRPKTKNSKRY